MSLAPPASRADVDCGYASSLPRIEGWGVAGAGFGMSAANDHQGHDDHQYKAEYHCSWNVVASVVVFWSFEEQIIPNQWDNECDKTWTILTSLLCCDVVLRLVDCAGVLETIPGTIKGEGTSEITTSPPQRLELMYMYSSTVDMWLYCNKGIGFWFLG